MNDTLLKIDRFYQSILEIDGPCSLAALVRQCLLLHVASAGVHLERYHEMLNLGMRKPHPSDLLVLAGEDDLAAVPVEGGGEDELRQAKVDQTLSCANVPDADVVV